MVKPARFHDYAVPDDEQEAPAPSNASPHTVALPGVTAALHSRQCRLGGRMEFSGEIPRSAVVIRRTPTHSCHLGTIWIKKVINIYTWYSLTCWNRLTTTYLSTTTVSKA